MDKLVDKWINTPKNALFRVEKPIKNQIIGVLVFVDNFSTTLCFHNAILCERGLMRTKYGLKTVNGAIRNQALTLPFISSKEWAM